MYISISSGNLRIESGGKFGAGEASSCDGDIEVSMSSTEEAILRLIDQSDLYIDRRRTGSACYVFFVLQSKIDNQQIERMKPIWGGESYADSTRLYATQDQHYQ